MQTIRQALAERRMSGWVPTAWTLSPFNRSELEAYRRHLSSPALAKLGANVHPYTFEWIYVYPDTENDRRAVEHRVTLNFHKCSTFVLQTSKWIHSHLFKSRTIAKCCALNRIEIEPYNCQLWRRSEKIVFSKLYAVHVRAPHASDEVARWKRGYD